MTRLVLPLVALAVLATAAWLYQDSDKQQTEPLRIEQGEKPQTPDRSAGLPEITPRAGKQTPEQIAAKILEDREKEQRARAAAEEAIQSNGLPFDPWTTPESAIFQTYHNQDMARLRWEKNTEKGRFVTTWFRKKDFVDMELFKKVENSSGAEQLEAMRAYNEHTETKRRELVQSLGVADANHVLKTFQIYRFDLNKRNWFRVDANGQRVPFLDEDDDIWENGETNGSSWDNHRN